MVRIKKWKEAGNVQFRYLETDVGNFSARIFLTITEPTQLV